MLCTFGLIFVTVFFHFEAQRSTDFDIFLAASGDLADGKNIYLTFYKQWYHYYYDVAFAGGLVPLTILPAYWARIIWLSLNFILGIRVLKIIYSWLPDNNLNRKELFFVILLGLLFNLRFFRDNFHLGQTTILILYLCIEGLNFIFINRPVWGAVLLAFGITIKILPLVLLPYLLYRGYWKESVFVVFFALILLYFPGFIIGFDYNAELLSARWQILNPLNPEHVLDNTERSFHSVSSYLGVLLVEDTGDFQVLDLKRNIADVPMKTLGWILLIVRSFFVLATFYFLKTGPFKREPDKLRRLYELSYILMIAPLIFPHQQHYAFLFVLPAAVYLIYYGFLRFRRKNQNRLTKIVWSTTLLIAYLAVSSHFILGEFNRYYDHFKVLTYGIFLLIILLAFSSPGKLESKTE